jgi:hypothetical protein
VLQLRRFAFASCALAGVLVGMPRDRAEAEPKSKANTTKPANPAVIECYKRAGMAINPYTKRWTMYWTENGGGIFRVDALRHALPAPKEFQQTRFPFMNTKLRDTAGTHRETKDENLRRR